MLVCCGRVTSGAAVNQVDFVAHLGFLCIGRNCCSYFIEPLEYNITLTLNLDTAFVKMTVCLSEYFTDAVISGLLSGQRASKMPGKAFDIFLAETDISACKSKQGEYTSLTLSIV